MKATILSSRLALATTAAALFCLPHGAGAQNSDGGNNSGRNNARIGNFKGGHLGHSSFGDGSAPASQSPDINSNPNPSGFGSPSFNNQPGGFLGRYGAGGVGAPGGSSQPPDPGSSMSRATIDGNRSGDGSIPPFPRRVGNTELRQWEVGANVPWDASYAYWANWGTNMGMLLEFGWAYPFMEMGMGSMGMMGMGGMGMGQPGANGWNGYGPPPAYGYGANPPAQFDRGSNPPEAGADNPPRPGEPVNGVPKSNPPPRTAPGFDDPTQQPNQNNNADTREQARINVDKGELRFRSGDYRGAAYYWKHASADDPQNGVLKMMRAQALFAIGQFSAAATATRDALRLLPENQWGVVVTNRRELYSDSRDYLDQLLALDKAAKANPADPALRFLAGFHYTYLGYPKAAVDNFDKGLKLAPQDALALKLRDEMQARVTATPPPPSPAPPE